MFDEEMLIKFGEEEGEARQTRAPEGIYTMTESEFAEEVRKAKHDAYEEGWHGGAGWPQSEGNPYKERQ